MTGSSTGAQTNDYVYNSDGTLVSRTANGTTTSYIQDLAADQSQILAGTVGMTTTDYLNGRDTAPLAALTGGTRTWYGVDGQGSVRQSLDDSGTILGVQNYDPFGQIEAGSSPIGPFGYTGELQDPTTGQEYLRARWYQPGSGTLLGVDPELATTGQPYSYANDDPVNGSDPSGACFEEQGNLLLVYKQVTNPRACTPGDLGPLGIEARSTDSYWLTAASSTALVMLEAAGAVTQDETVFQVEKADLAYDETTIIKEEAAELASGEAAAVEATQAEETLLAENTETLASTPAWPLVLARVALTVGLAALIGLSCIEGAAAVLNVGAPLGDLGPQPRTQPTAVDTPTATPPSTPSATPTPTATPQPNTVYAADANILFGRPKSEVYRTNPNLTFLMPPLIIEEVTGAAKPQLRANARARLLAGLAGRGVAKIIPVGAPQMPPGSQSWLRGKFGPADAQLLQTATGASSTV